MKILILGTTGMLGNAVFKQFSNDPQFDVWGTLRNASGRHFFPEPIQDKLVTNVDVLNQDALIEVISKVCPDIVINCVGLVKQLSHVNDPLQALPLNAMLPHRLAKICELSDTRLVHFSTDCVFSGKKGMYTEGDVSDAEDLYGKSKFMGEIHNVKNAITLRTSMIGHELVHHNVLIDWFLSQEGRVRGFSRAIFSGLPTVELARIVKDFVLPNQGLSGLFHVSAKPINKFDLLNLVAEVYQKDIVLEMDENLVIDRSLDSTLFEQATGYTAPEWTDLIRLMHKFK